MPPALVGGGPALLSVCGQVTVPSSTSGLAASPKATWIEPLPRSVTDTWPSPDSLSSSWSRLSIRSLGWSPAATAVLIAVLRLAIWAASWSISPPDWVSDVYSALACVAALVSWESRLCSDSTTVFACS